MSHYITQERATALAKSLSYGDTNSPYTVLNPVGLHSLCEAAIKSYIERYKHPLTEAYWVDCMASAASETAKNAPQWKDWPGTATFARAMFPVVKSYAALCAEAALRNRPTEAPPPSPMPAPPAAPTVLPPAHSYVVEGWEGGKLVAISHAYELPEAKRTASTFAQHYSTVHTKPLHTAGAVTLWGQEQVAQALHERLQKP